MTKTHSQIETLLAALLQRGVNRIGEILIRGEFELLHHADADRSDLQFFNNPEDAREIAKYDESGNFRPLKTAPNLRCGWKLVLRDLHELREALDCFYPAMPGVLFAHECSALEVVDLRETLNRQTGMYAVTKKISNKQANELIAGFCRSDNGCLKTILWRIDANTPVTSLPPCKFDPAANQLGQSVLAIPLLCHEACNLLVAAARNKVKSE